MECAWEDRGRSVNEEREECDLGESGERVERKKEKKGGVSGEGVAKERERSVSEQRERGRRCDWGEREKDGGE